MINKCLSIYLLQITHLRKEKKREWTIDCEKSSSSSTTLSSFSKEFLLLHNTIEKERRRKNEQRKENHTSLRFDFCLIIKRLVDWQTYTLKKEHKGKIIFLVEMKERIKERKSKRASKQARTKGTILYERNSITHLYHIIMTMIDLRTIIWLDYSSSFKTCVIVEAQKEKEHVLFNVKLIEKLFISLYVLIIINLNTNSRLRLICI